MKYSELFGKTAREAPSDEIAVNARLLLKAGFIDKLISGSYTLLPLGLRVVKKIEQVIREEMNTTGAQEILMPLLHPKEIWNETGRWEKARDVMYQFEKNKKEFALSFTHEEIVLDIIRKHAFTYREFPIKIYQFSTKFRDELRAKSGILRGREFLMKDLYSAHTSQEDLDKYYWEVKDAYLKIFQRFGLKAYVAEAAGGVFTESHTHEFQILSEGGEDTIFYCENGDFAQNREIAKVTAGIKCPKCSGTIKEGKSIEVGNIFRFGTVYSEKMKVQFTDASGKKQLVYFGSYGIGLTRLVGTLVELFHDDRGIVWPKVAAPYQAHLIDLRSNLQKGDSAERFALYEKLQKAGIEVLYDDRADISAGEKFADADLIGIPIRLVVSARVDRGKVEVKKRNEQESKIMAVEEAINLIN
ncbi:MAG: hypothetical protein A3C27_01445 [Candidatus Levybacteria bacterium RIFCSPHIGHO2_02_FULL_39_36]|nr:MAG: Prolyl-tRNA synthetase [Candidatus Levybacteria bacterium GW2011_GWA1_39_11]KKR26495.1 MAG: Prolyl-tRNA synthetase [Microgenomates group bacterium GW2011_GWC1_39_7]KKR49322.1 MAG: Prolyl-tRNA synthetase [Candidatus Levybacteria bacterium GW2011_GWA2_40_16]OGH15082.1 MAG: hypothetical protein A2689_00290 [Candidatus Levybacteria bacterium RIFCSPHIGHO2_01_FULL_38_96]OGH25988.1 MAG: hypothetical protein A3E68_01430 [Candidatus Levybacteria bacterium RIFCSPHIGHO2_12_FULL_39_39]OGH27325.1 M